MNALVFTIAFIATIYLLFAVSFAIAAAIEYRSTDHDIGKDHYAKKFRQAWIWPLTALSTAHEMITRR